MLVQPRLATSHALLVIQEYGSDYSTATGAGGRYDTTTRERTAGYPNSYTYPGGTTVRCGGGFQGSSSYKPLARPITSSASLFRGCGLLRALCLAPAFSARNCESGTQPETIPPLIP